MTFQEATAVLKDLIGRGVRMIDIEKELKIPKNNLSGFLSGRRKTKKWQKVIIAYAVRLKKAIPPEPKLLLPPPKKAAKKPAPDKTTPAAAAVPAKALPPHGLSKSEKFKWLRQNNQTLQ